MCLCVKILLEVLSKKASSPYWFQTSNLNNNLFQWTDSKTALVELIYAICASGSLNHGQCKIRGLTAFFEQIFNIRLTVRSTPTKHIDNLKTALLRKMEEDL